jgi:hypothetical protein
LQEFLANKSVPLEVKTTTGLFLYIFSRFNIWRRTQYTEFPGTQESDRNRSLSSMSRAVRRAESSKTPANPPFAREEALPAAIGNFTIRRPSIRDILVLGAGRYSSERGDFSEMVRATDFAAFDVAVDLRRSSPTLGGQVGATLTAEGGL